MGQKSRQHYVPKFYLRNFSETDKSISTFNITNSKYIQNASIKDMCQKNNFYGDDKVVEEFLDKEIERKASAIIRRIIETKSIPNIDKEFEYYEHLIAFLLVSEARNLRSADSADNMADFLAKEMMKEHPGMKDIDLDEFKIKIKQAANQNIGIALESIPLVLDLKPVLINQKTPRSFITSDNPLIRYNSFYIGRKYHGRGFGYVTRGLQLFCPISPTQCLLLYDGLVYDIPNIKDDVITINRAREVDSLNELFYLNAYNNVFFNQKIKEDYIKKFTFKNRGTSKISDLKREVGSFKSMEEDGQLISVTQNRVTKKISLPWITQSEFGKGLILPQHMGGLKRMESPFIEEYIEKDSEKFDKHPPKIKSGSYFREK
ncbi:hypothetical protein BN982_03588 [Halobacillus karajensis]|uniref:DUF4238 domain-containing protein n=1 Tax=Halobacillus karajensis TaxID=195088 RepID=A0A024P7W4_9BACI|nr:hypothetical protein BN982_03588 [Halobacillus karajensis]CDQ24716.1 hypothetical protein BN983_03012 [Halobacillus karajensis]CDQ28924.1 hypothetical protein BN981_03242 [Halobacillus karajensis]